MKLGTSPPYFRAMASRAAGIGIGIALALAGAAAFYLLRSGPPADAPPGERAPPAASPAPGRDAAAPDRASRPASPAGTLPGTEEAAAEARGVLVVTVVGLPSGAPLAGAEVEIRTADGEVLGTAKTADEGLARFEGLAPDFVSVATRAPGRVRGWTGVSDLAKPGERTVTVELEPGVALAGIVLAAGSRRPVPAAHVTAKLGGSIGHMSSFSSSPPLMETEADLEGRFRVDGIPRKEIVTLAARAPGFVPSGRSLMLGEGAEEHPVVEVLLEAAAHASGQVTDPDGRALAGAEVRAVLVEVEDGKEPPDLAALEAGGGPWGHGLRSAGIAKSGDDGRYVMDGLRVGVPYRLFARAPGLARSTLSDPARAAEAAGERIACDLRLRRPSTLRVRVVDAAGAPLAEARAWMEMDVSGQLAPESEGGGTFRFDLLLAGEYEVSAGCAGHEEGKATFAVGDAETKEGRVVLAPQAKPPGDEPQPAAARNGQVRLLLVAPRGVDPPARVTVAVEDVRSGGGVGYTKGWNEGRLVLTDIEPVPKRIVVSIDGYAPIVREVEIAEGEDSDLGAVTIEPGAELAGRVQDAAGNPLAGARVIVDLPGFMDSAVGTTGADGRFRVLHLPTGDRLVRIAAEGLLDGRDTVAIGPGVNSRTFTLVPPVRVRGTVKNAEGKAVEGACVAFVLVGDAPPGVPREITEWPDGDGAFATAVAAGAFVVEARDAEGHVLARAEATFDGKSEGRVDLVIP